MLEKPPLTVVIGPTAAGKTAYAIQYAKTCNGAVISADSRQIYTGMDIGTAKPPLENSRVLTGQAPHGILVQDIVEGIPHYLLNIATPDKQLTLSDWQSAAFEVIEHARAQGYHPILAGGTMLYVDSIVFNYSIPNVEPNKNLRAELDKETPETLFKKLIEQDPAAKDFVEPHHKQRIIRALEVMKATSKPFSEVRKKQEPKYICDIHGIFPGGPESESGWKALEDNISKRAEAMINDGLIEETQKLRDAYSANLPLLQTMNYKQAGCIIDGTMQKKEAQIEMIRANVRYARRQMSWWRGRSEIKWLKQAAEYPVHPVP